MNKKFINFTHIPKCAGTAFYFSLIESSMSESDVFVPRSLAEIRAFQGNYRYILGHWPHGTCRAMSNNQFISNGVVNIVAFREPIEQAKSLYRYYTLAKSGAKEYRRHRDEGILSFYSRKKYLRNLQSKYLLGRLWVHHRSPLHLLSEHLSSTVARMAMRRVRRSYQFVLLQEDTERGFKEIGDALGLSCKFQRPDLTATAEAKLTTKICPDEIEILRGFFTQDLILFRWVREQYLQYGMSPENWR